MPVKLERQLWREAKEKFPGEPDKQRKYVYGTLRQTGWKPRKFRRAKTLENEV